MTILLYFCLGLFLIIIQTTVLPHIYFFDRMYDLLLPVVIHVSIFRPLGISLFLVILFGVLMDNLSGSPAGFYLTFYVWILIAVRYLKLFLHVGSITLVTLVVLLAVALESMVLMGLVMVNNTMISGAGNTLRCALAEVMWAIVTAPLILMGLNQLLKKLPALLKTFSLSRQEEIKRR